MIEIEQKPFRIIADLGATSSGIYLSVVKELNLLASMKATEYTYRRLGRWRRRWGRWKFLCELGRSWLKRI
jgi:hypothetical protein